MLDRKLNLHLPDVIGVTLPVIFLRKTGWRDGILLALLLVLSPGVLHRGLELDLQPVLPRLQVRLHVQDVSEQ